MQQPIVKIFPGIELCRGQLHLDRTRRNDAQRDDTMTISISPAQVEWAEAESYIDFTAAAAAETKAALGMRQLRISGGVALAMPNDSSGFWSKALGLGFSGPVTVGLMDGGATLPRARGRGAQSALIAARALAARAAGCDWLVAETFAERPGEHNSSLRNMLRAGMTTRYERRNWVWRRPLV